MITPTRTTETDCPRLDWTDGSGCRWSATLIRGRSTPSEEYEIQIESESGPPERVLCVGPVGGTFEELSLEELELVREAARTQRGILWLDSREGRLWWVDQERRDGWRWVLTYSSSRWIRSTWARTRFPLALLGSGQHRRLLEGARLDRPVASGAS